MRDWKESARANWSIDVAFERFWLLSRQKLRCSLSLLSDWLQRYGTSFSRQHYHRDAIRTIIISYVFSNSRLYLRKRKEEEKEEKEEEEEEEEEREEEEEEEEEREEKKSWISIPFNDREALM